MSFTIRTLNKDDKVHFELFLKELLLEKQNGFRYSLSTINEIDDLDSYFDKIKLLETSSLNPDYSPVRGIDKVFITALTDNKASRATIEKLGGIFHSFYIRSDGEEIARYWVPTS
ncbi:hypothetical protein KNZ16_20610 [Streptococcus dysgalactiae subsp. equisimilis]|uniref:hypothetical protein n=1 Tax=Streptococcus dysgalactiae TaxID=1334 RepID=UPI0012C52C55|nr:hypothetical protein [Streptococcus dysgalactiae]GET85341.1 hypothetical protein KNZ16_20610 [Streptococcus dysgalactiae subsp. equisimilis]